MLKNRTPYSFPLPHGLILPETKIGLKYYKELAISPNSSNYVFLKHLCMRGLKERGIDKYDNVQVYYDRLKLELDTFKELGFIDYVLLNWDILNFCVENDIPKGRGRGSGAGSLVLYCINVTDIEPIKMGLYFERFVSKARARSFEVDGIKYLDGSLAPDVDHDIGYYERQKVIDYIYSKHEGKTSQILTFNTLSSKLCVKECGKIIGDYSEQEMNHISDVIPKIFGKVKSIKESRKEEKKFDKWCEKNLYVAKVAERIGGLIKNFGVHPSGIAISNKNIKELMPLQTTKDGSFVTGYDMDKVSEYSVKFDILGLRTLSVVRECCKLLRIKESDIDYTDDSIYEALQNLRHPTGLFQIEADCNYRVCTQVKPVNLFELSDVVALARPGALAFVDDYVKVKNGQTEIKKWHPELDKILNKTKGLFLYQESLMQVAHKVFGLSLEDAESIRRACVTGDTRFVSKSRGWITIDRLLKEGYKEDLFLVVDEYGREFWKPITNLWSSGRKQIRYVECKNGNTVKASMYHQFLTNQGWKSRLRLNGEDFISCVNKVSYEGEKTISDDIAIVLAGLMTEGYFVWGKQITFTNYDLSIYNQFYKSAVNVFGEDQVVKRPCGKVIGIKNKSGLVLNKYMKRGKSGQKTIPEVIFSQDIETVKKFISFAWACEGTITDKELSFSSKSRNLIEGLKMLLMRFGLNTFFIEKDVENYGTYFILNISSCNRKYSIKEFSNLFSEFLQDYKKDKLSKFVKSGDRKITWGGNDIIPQNIIEKFLNQYPFIPHKNKQECGSIYTGNVGREKFFSWCSQSGDRNWIDVSKSNLCYSQIKNLNKEIREIEVFDFTVDEETPFIVANGMIIHNCGKKKLKDMRKWKPVVFEQAEKLGIEKKVADFYWKALKDSADYSFNFSHSASYASLSATTVYLKFNHPKEFFTALLNMARYEPDPLKEVHKIARELPHFGIKLLPPNLKKSTMDFHIEGDAIRYGLSMVKGISDKTVDPLQDFVSLEKNNKYDVFLCAKQAGMNIGALSSLIQAGALPDHLHKRSRLVLEAQSFNILTEREKRNFIILGPKYDYDLLACIKDASEKKLIADDGKPLMKESRFKTFSQKYNQYKEIYNRNSKYEDYANWYFETKLLGYSITKTIGEVFGDSFSCSENIKDLGQYEVAKFVGVVEDVVKRKSRNGNQYIRLTMKDELGSYQAMMVDNQREETLTKYLNKGGEVPKEDDIVVLRASKGDDILFVQDMDIVSAKIYMKLSDLK